MPLRHAAILAPCLMLAACAAETNAPAPAASAVVASLPAPNESNAQAKLFDLGRCHAEAQERVADPDDARFKAAVDRCMRGLGYRRDDIAEAKPRRAS